jgi:carbon monoxide dehydrogenase subunit G
MKLEHSFAVQAPLQTVWEALTDVERVAPCLPGAQVHAGEDGEYEGTFSVKLGPTKASYQGSLRMESLDEDAHVATMRAEGRDRRGQGGAKATIVSSMRTEGDMTHVDVVTDFTITGRLARFGRGGMIEDVSNRLLSEFSDCLEQRLSSGDAVQDGAAEAVPPSGNGSLSAEEPTPTAPPPPPPPAAAPEPEPFDAGGAVGSLLQDRLKQAGPLVLLALVLGWLIGRRG